MIPPATLPTIAPVLRPLEGAELLIGSAVMVDPPMLENVPVPVLTVLCPKTARAVVEVVAREVLVAVEDTEEAPLEVEDAEEESDEAAEDEDEDEDEELVVDVEVALTEG